MIVLHELGRYWNWAGSNVGAMPACGLVGLLAAVIFRKPLLRLWDRIKADLHRGVRSDIAEIRQIAEKAHRISADTHRALTGLDHPDAPASEKRKARP